MKTSTRWEMLWDLAYLACGNVLNDPTDPKNRHASIKRNLKLGLIRVVKDEYKVTAEGSKLLRKVIAQTGWKKGPLILMMQAQKLGGIWSVSGSEKNNEWLASQKLAKIVNFGSDLQITRDGRYMVNLAVEKLHELLQDVPPEPSGAGDGEPRRAVAA